MTIQPGAVLYTQGLGSRPEGVEVPHLDVRAPTIYDIKFPVGKRWIDQVGQGTYTLVDFISTSNVVHAIWLAEGGFTHVGSVPLVAGTATVSTTAVIANSIILLTVASLGTVTAPQAMHVSAINAGVSFAITSADATDTSIVNWLIVN